MNWFDSLLQIDTGTFFLEPNLSKFYTLSILKIFIALVVLLSYGIDLCPKRANMATLLFRMVMGILSVYEACTKFPIGGMYATLAQALL